MTLTELLRFKLAELRADAHAAGVTDAHMMNALNWGPYRLRRTFEHPTRLRHYTRLMTLLGVYGFSELEIKHG